jgi:hypothetical protein
MNSQEMREMFEKNVNYLKRNIAPDDIYEFSEQTFMAALFFLKKWSEKSSVGEACIADPVAQKWVNNILGLLKCRDKEVDIKLDLDLDWMDDEDNS